MEDRTTLILGGLPRDTSRSDIEETLRGIIEGYEGVEKVASMGRYATCGRVYFNNKDVMWEFIKANKGNKFEHDGVERAIWFTIEETTDERLISTKVGYPATTLVAFLTDGLKMEPPLALKSCDADYTRGMSCTYRGEGAQAGGWSDGDAEEEPVHNL